ncbi:hypothetical protein ACFVH6_33370 [Spirillospora sp. NPDC127200]
MSREPPAALQAAGGTVRDRPLLDEVVAAGGDRVPDMGTGSGSGVNAIMAASRAADAVAVGINPIAVA